MALFKKTKTKKKSRGRMARGFFNTFLNVPAWLGLKGLSEQSLGTYKFLRPVYRARMAKREETFAAALQRLNLTEEGLKTRRVHLRWQLFLFGSFAILMAGYMMYLFAGLYVGPAILAGLVALLFAMKMLHCKLWIFQIDHRKLGCSWREVLNGHVVEKE